MGVVMMMFSLAYAIFEIPRRLARRSDRPAQSPHPHCHLVVRVHDGDGPGGGLLVVDDGAIPVRRRRGRSVPESHEGLQQLVRRRRPDAGAGDHVARRALGRRADAASRRVRARLRELARVVLHLRCDWLLLGVLLLPLVPRPARAASGRECGGTVTPRQSGAAN